MGSDGADGRQAMALPSLHQVHHRKGVGLGGQPEENQTQNIVYFRDDDWHHEPVRIAYMFVYVPEQPHRRVVIQVGETLKKRQDLANEIIAGIIVPQFFLFPLIALLVWFGLERGTLPLDRLRQRLLSRRPYDLSPIDVREVPEEIAPLIEAFNDLMDRLAHNLKAQERFIADAAHQMRTPLAGLRTQLELALRQSDPAEMRANLERIRAGVERASHAISQLLSLARSQSETPPEFEPVDVNALVREVTQSFVAQALAVRIDLGFEESAPPAWIDGSSLLLRELFSNLIDNALRYTPMGGRVTARVRARDFVTVDIEDNGIGIGDQERELIFERFYRVPGTDAAGTGLGLPIVRSIAALHRAAVKVGPNPLGRGSLFTVVFPRLFPSTGTERSSPALPRAA